MVKLYSPQTQYKYNIYKAYNIYWKIKMSEIKKYKKVIK